MSAFAPTLGHSLLREAIRAMTRAPEPGCVQALMADAQQPPAQAATVNALALRLAEGVRRATRQRTGLLGSGGRAGLVQGLLQEFALSSQEGVALMCLAEALLRIPDAATRDALIRDKISRGDWRAHLGRSPSPFVNAAAWGLLLTGRLVSTHSDARLGGALKRVLARGGEPLVRKGVDLAMRLMGEQFVTGQTIEEALIHAGPREARGFRFSYDMLGEAALTDADARTYLAAYEHAIDAIGAAAAGRGIHQGPGISIKLSALHPRYSRAQAQRVMDELYPRLLHLAQRARQHDIGLNIDAEESERLDLSLDLLERLCFEPSLAGWNGVGFVIQAYGKRCPAVIDFLVDLARRSQRRLMVRLVKGAYWDSEIKRAQLDGLSDYPVYTRKAHTDVAYLACARQLLATHDAIYPQFATHNAHTLAAVHEMAGPDSPADAYEFQCLHGMGETLYEQVVAGPAAGGLGRPCRIYAPVGTHETLLAYLVRRLLENGANTSFVNRVADESLPLQALVQDPVQTVRAAAEREGLLGAPHPAIARPADLYRRGQASASGENTGRENAAGLDLADETTLARLGPVLWATRDRVDATDGLALSDAADQGQILAVRNPADPTDIVGTVRHATADAVQAALAAAHVEFTRADGWPAWPPARRAHCLELAADALQADTEALICLLVREAGKTVANAVAEVREAVDFLRFYGQQIRQGWQVDTHRPLGPVACISPWNFPLAIFLGQVAAALAAGNTVFAKPAEQTPLVAQRAVAALHAAGVPAAALHLLPGDGPTVGAALVGDARVQAVLFTGSTEVARLLQRTLAQRLDARGRPVTLVAETGGQNALVVDSSALLEQVTQDVLVSAFDSAGQRCSALRVLCVQEDVADRLIEMIEGALRTWRVGDPRQLATDVGPVIDEEARAVIEAHIAAMRARGLRIHQPAQVDPKVLRQGHFVTPTLIEIDDLKVLTREVFGPVLNVLRYRRDELPALLEQVRATGYGLTMGVHSRIDETIAQVVQGSSAGNLYVNRTIVGAVVGVQPFGGEGLSGTGPKAGGPLYLLRLLAERPDTAARQAVEASGSPAEVPVRGLAMPENRHPALQALSDWAEARGQNALIQTLMALEAQRPRQAHATWRTLPGPTGEANLYTVTGREQVLCLADDDADRLTQLAAVLAAGGQAVWPAQCSSLYDRLPAAVRNAIVLANDWRDAHVHLDAALHHGDAASRQTLLKTLAERPGPIVALTTLNPGERRIPLERLWLERSLSINTAAAGGNASLMTLGEG